MTMMQRLRRKFILINMLLVTAVLLITFAVLCVSTYRQQAAESTEALRRALEKGGGPPPQSAMGSKPLKEPLMAAPVVSVLVDETGAIASIGGGAAADMDGEALEQAVAEVLAAEKAEGVLASLDLRYMRRELGSGYKIALADRSGERQTMIHLLGTSLLVGLGGLTAFFFISLFLSGWALRPVKRAWEQQRQFVADASHELKTPLTVILANTDILLAHREDTIAAQSKWVEYIREESHRMKGLVDDMLFLAKSDAQQAPVRAVRFHVSDTVLGCVLPFESVAFERGIQLSSEVLPGAYMTGDEGQIRQLVMILLDNACKYAGDKGTVALTLSREGDKLRLTVNNSGAPIAPEHLRHLFERFYRADASRSREQGGYGLGLAIAQSIVQRHRGRIAVTSDEERGTTFSVWLPGK